MLSAKKSKQVLPRQRLVLGGEATNWNLIEQIQQLAPDCQIFNHYDQPFQVVYRHVNLPWEQHDWRGVSPTEQQQLLENFLQTDREQDFDLDKPLLMRLNLIQLADDKHQFIWSKHHLILDGWSTAIVFKEVFDAYEALHQGSDLSVIRSRP
ncbi:condensation domain-containing protein [Nostoc sp. CHAB 5784]|uniref:condensation domain-containing protein n=1 Tax=Nostoc mirabile TaxID=2907820 RepID=UPI001E2F26A8|nr:condensation domain-containing protein [Nostoc mirabile]MCC5670500.1 condensation domain-containing protein [Nostoc mirabile CHAB5784]